MYILTVMQYSWTRTKCGQGHKRLTSQDHSFKNSVSHSSWLNTWGQYHEGRRPSSDDSFHNPAVIPPSALDKPSIMKPYHRRRTTRWGVTARSPTMVTLHDTRFVECRWWNDGWTVKTVVTWRSSASMIPAPVLQRQVKNALLCSPDDGTLQSDAVLLSRFFWTPRDVSREPKCERRGKREAGRLRCLSPCKRKARCSREVLRKVSFTASQDLVIHWLLSRFSPGFLLMVTTAMPISGYQALHAPLRRSLSNPSKY